LLKGFNAQSASFKSLDLKAMYFFLGCIGYFDMAQVDTFGIIYKITFGETFP
jgi:hypothetical protein